MRFLLIFITLSALTSSALSKTNVNESAFVFDSSNEYLNIIKNKPDLSIDHMIQDGYEVYGPKGLHDFLFKNNIKFENLNVRSYLESKMNDYPDFEEIENQLKSLNNKFPEITKLYSIGSSTEGRSLWVMKVSDNPHKDEKEPEVKYISSMHGNEITGRELMINLLEDLLENYDVDQRITNLINNTEIYIMPSMNPDGSHYGWRGNANYVDLNRDFPDFSTSDSNNVYEGREPETQAVMKFQKNRKFALSANFHGGAECVNYPWDTIPDQHPRYNLVYDISLDYSKAAPYIYASTYFRDGVTNGFEWYEVNGGMQDWSDHWHGDLQVTIELSMRKWPPYETIDYYYQQNRESLIQFLEKVHQGAGFYFDQPGVSGFVNIYKKIDDNYKSIGSFSFDDSEFYRVLEPGEYMLEIIAQNSTRYLKNIFVEKDNIRHNGNFSQISF